MAQWEQGYVNSVAYTIDAYAELTPAWLATCSLLLGFRPPDLGKPFRYADLGCGNGMTALFAAAAYPHAEIWGFDFNPAHVEFARDMAERAGLTNAHFAEASFEELAGPATSYRGDHDIIAAHGVLAWISAENRQHVFRIIGRWLKPGGLAYLSYNVPIGWAAMRPVQQFVRQWADTSPEPPEQAVATAFDLIDQLRSGGARFFQDHAALGTWLDHLKTRPARYLVHEFLNRSWHPLMHADVKEGMAETKARYIGSATLLENNDMLAVPAAVMPLLEGIVDPDARETLRDIAGGRGFRRDLWRRGAEPVTGPEFTARLDALTLIGTGKQTDDPIVFKGPLATVTGQGEFYRPVLEALRRGPVTVGALRSLPALAGRPVAEFTQAVSLLIACGYAHGVQPGGDTPEARGACRRLNEAITEQMRMGLDHLHLVSPVTGAGMGVSVTEGLVIGVLLRDPACPRDRLTDQVIAELAASGRAIQHDGKPVTDLGAMRVRIGEIARVVMEERLEMLRALAILA